MSRKRTSTKTIPARLPLVCADGCWVEKMTLTPRQAAHLNCLLAKPEWEPACGDCDRCPLIQDDTEDQGRWLDPEEIVDTLPDDPKALKKYLIVLMKHAQKMNGRKD
jgi:hypothetical protein